MYLLAVNNIKSLSNFYISKLGFDLIWDTGFWQCVGRYCIKILLGECPDEVPAAQTGHRIIVGAPIK